MHLCRIAWALILNFSFPFLTGSQPEVRLPRVWGSSNQCVYLEPVFDLGQMFVLCSIPTHKELKSDVTTLHEHESPAPGMIL